MIWQLAWMSRKRDRLPYPFASPPSTGENHCLGSCNEAALCNDAVLASSSEHLLFLLQAAAPGSCRAVMSGNVYRGYDVVLWPPPVFYCSVGEMGRSTGDLLRGRCEPCSSFTLTAA